jgi:hypothetical protein
MRKILTVALLAALSSAAWDDGDFSAMIESLATATAQLLAAFDEVVASAADTAARSGEVELDIEGLVEGLTASVTAAVGELKERLPTAINFMVGSMLRVTADALANVDLEGMEYENSEGRTVPYSELTVEEQERVREAFEEAVESLRGAAEGMD